MLTEIPGLQGLARINFLVGEPGVGKSATLRYLVESGTGIARLDSRPSGIRGIFGEGFKQAAGRTLVVDPMPERHPAEMRAFCHDLYKKAVLWDVQVFLVTHSRDLIVAAHAAIPAGEFVVFRLERHAGRRKPVVFRLDHESLAALIHYGSQML